MKKFERQILIDLYESTNGLFAFTLYSRYKVEPSILFVFIDKYVKKGIIKFEDDKIFLTEDGKKIILKQLFKIKSRVGKFSNIPEEYKGQIIEINVPYLPNRKMVSDEILKIKKVE